MAVKFKPPKIEGINFVIRNMRLSVDGTARGLRNGITRATAHLKRKSNVIVPVDTGNLRGTSRMDVRGKDLDVVGTVSYGTDYGVFVHEDPRAAHQPGKEYKFLERPSRTERPTMLQMIKQSVADGIKKAIHR